MSSPLTNLRAAMNEAKEEIRADYSAARSSRFRRARPGVSGVGRGADYHLRNENDYFYMLEYVRDMHRNDGMIRQLTKRAVDLTIGPGFSVDFKTRDAKLNRALNDDFYDWWMHAHRFDVGRTVNGPMSEKLVFRQMLTDGDHLAIGLASMKMQFIEGHRVRTPTYVRTPDVRLGVYKDDAGDLYRYTISQRADDPWNAKLLKADAMSVDTWLDAEQGIRQVFHVRSIERSSDTRGITAWAPVFDYAGMFEDTNFALLVKQQMAAFLALSKDTVTGATPSRTDIGQSDVVATTVGGLAGPGGQLSDVQSMRTGSIVDPGPGKKYSVLQANVPSPETMAHIRFILQMLSLNLGLPLIMALLDASETNFSGWKGATNLAEIGFQSNQNDLDAQYHTPITRLWLYRKLHEKSAIGNDLRRNAEKNGVEDCYRHVWNKPRLKSVQPVEDAKADDLRLASGTTSMPRVQAEKGQDAYEVLGERMRYRFREIGRAHKTAERLKGIGVLDVTWRDVLAVGAAVDVIDTTPEPPPDDAQATPAARRQP